MSIIKQDYGSLGNDVQTQMLIAPVLAEMVATQAFAINDQFIVDNVLYKATKAIAIGDAISVGTSASDNCILSDSITQQMNKDHYNDFGTSVDVESYTVSNRYVCPSDGYLYARAGLAAGSYAGLVFYGTTSESVYMTLEARTYEGNVYDYASVYVRKGTRVYCSGKNGSSSLVRFIPLTA